VRGPYDHVHFFHSSGIISLCIWILRHPWLLFQNLQLHRHFPMSARDAANILLKLEFETRFSLITVLRKARVVLIISRCLASSPGSNPDSFQARAQPSRYRLYTLATAQFFSTQILISVICEENEGTECNMINLLESGIVRSYDGLSICCCLSAKKLSRQHTVLLVPDLA